jgi:integrase
VLLDELPCRQRDMKLFALATGLRQADVMQLEWPQVDLERQTCWVDGEEAKADEDLHVSLNDVAQDVLRRQRGKHRARVFSYHGRPIAQVNTKAWRKALQWAGIENFRWHDLRHTWASWLVQHGTHSMSYRRSAAGSRQRWYGATPTWRQRRWPAIPQLPAVCSRRAKCASTTLRDEDGSTQQS